jgi:hypothetical protein
MIYCYNCGSVISRKEGTETKEHIPAQNLFVGFGDEYKKNRIAVPSCLKCNGDSTNIDEEFRNVIGTISNFDSLSAISHNTAKAIVTHNHQYDRLRFNKSGNVIGVQFDKKLILDNHIKVFKGLYYHQYRKPIGKEYTIIASMEPDAASGSCIQYLQENFEWKHSGHPDVFSYILQPVRENVNNPDKKDLTPQLNEPFFVAIQKYNNSHAGLVIATNTEIKRR